MCHDNIRREINDCGVLPDSMAIRIHDTWTFIGEIGRPVHVVHAPCYCSDRSRVVDLIPYRFHIRGIDMDIYFGECEHCGKAYWAYYAYPISKKEQA